MRFARRERNSGAENIGAFDAYHWMPFLVAEISQACGAVAPRVPHDGGCGVPLLREQFAAGERINDFSRAGGIEVRIVDLGGECEFARLNLLAVPIHIVEERYAVQSTHLNALDVTDTEIGVQSLFETEFGRADVGR